MSAIYLRSLIFLHRWFSFAVARS